MRPPRGRLAPRDRNHQAPPATAGVRRQGTRGGLRGTPPPSPPLAHGQPEAGQEGGGPAPPPREGRDTQGGDDTAAASAAARQVPRVAAHSLPRCPRPTGNSGPALKDAL